MKIIILILLAVGTLLALAACSSANRQAQPDTSPVHEPDSTPANQPSEPEPETSASADGGKTLVVYYSATGSTEAKAGYIANTLDGDTFAITPVGNFIAANDFTGKRGTHQPAQR